MRKIGKVIREKGFSYLFTVVLLFTGLLFVNDSVIWNVTPDAYCPYFSLPASEADLSVETLESLKLQFDEKGFDIAIVRWWIDMRANAMHIYVYGSEDAQAAYKKAAGFSSDTLRSCFSRDVKYHYSALGQAGSDEKQLLGRLEDDMMIVVLARNGENVSRKLSVQWYWSLGLKNFHGAGYTLWGEVKSQISGVALMIVLAVLFLQYYNVVSRKKRYFVEIVYGTTAGEVILRNVTVDSVFYLFCALGMGISSRTVFSIPFGILPYLVFCGALILGNLCWYLSLLRYSFREAHSGSRLNEGEMAMSHLLRAIVLSVVILLITLSLSSASEFLSLRKSKSFFEQQKDWNAAPAALSLSDTDAWYDYYLQSVNNGTGEKYMSRGTFLEGEKEYTIIETGSNSKKWLREWYPSAKIPEEGNFAWVILYPDRLDAKTCKKVIGESYSSGKGELLFLPYKEKRYAMTDKNTLQCDKNLVYVIDLNDRKKKDLGDGLLPEEIFQAYFRLQEAVDRITLPNGESVEAVPLYDKFMKEYVWTRNRFLGELSFTFLLLLMLAMITGRVLHQEFETDSVRYVILRLHGSGVLQTYYFLFVSTIVAGGIGFALTRIFMRMGLLPENRILGPIVTGCVVVLELTMIVCRILRMEHVCVQKILKGGAI